MSHAKHVGIEALSKVNNGPIIRNLSSQSYGYILFQETSYHETFWQSHQAFEQEEDIRRATDLIGMPFTLRSNARGELLRQLFHENTPTATTPNGSNESLGDDHELTHDGGHGRLAIVIRHGGQRKIGNDVTRAATKQTVVGQDSLEERTMTTCAPSGKSLSSAKSFSH